MLRHGSSLRHPSLLHRWLLVCSLAVAAGCGTLRESGTTPGLFLIDTLTRSQALPGVDFHLRYAERSGQRLTLHVAFYNNGPTDLAQVRGVDIHAARLVGATAEAPVEVSASLENGIVPPGGWLSSGATNGSLVFDAGTASTFNLLMPGFGTVPFRLHTPLLALPETKQASPVQSQPGYEVQSTENPETILVIEAVQLTDRVLDLTLVVHDPQEHEPGEATLEAARRAVVFDSRWNQYRSAPGPAIFTDPGKGDVADDALIARFEAPAGDMVLLKVPSFPLLRIPLYPDEPLELATVSDLPPSTSPRELTADTLATAQSQASPLDNVLTSLNRALARGTREQYLELFVPALREPQGQIFDTIRSLPLETVMLQSRAEGAPDTSSGSEPSISYRVAWSYRVAGTEPDERLSAEAELNLHREAGHWQITRLEAHGPFWALGSTEAERVGPFWIFFRPAARSRLAALKTDLSVALQQVEQRLPGRARATHVMFVTETPQEFADLTGRDPNRFSGLALSRYRIDASGITTTEATFYINGAAFQSASEADRRQTLVHELTHLLLAPTTMPFTPVWLVEGMAMEVANDLPVMTMRAQITAGALDTFSLDAFTTQTAFGLHDPGGTQTAVDYSYAAYLARYLVERYGFETFLAFYDSFAEVPIETIRYDISISGSEQESSRTLGMLAGKLTPERLQSVYSIDLATLERDFVAWAREQGG